LNPQTNPQLQQQIQQLQQQLGQQAQQGQQGPFGSFPTPQAIQPALNAANNLQGNLPQPPTINLP